MEDIGCPRSKDSNDPILSFPSLTTPSSREYKEGNDEENKYQETKSSFFMSSRIISWIISIPSRKPKYTTESLNWRNYQAFITSNYAYFCGGIFRTSLYCSISYKDIKLPVLPFTLTLIILPIVLYSIFEAYWLWHKVSPAVVILFCYCWLQTFSNCLKAALLDPGVLPKNIHITDGLDKDGLPNEYHNWIELPGPMDKLGNIQNVYMKYCDSCYIWRPVRASHCSKCGVCIGNMDHHCPWLGNCIGQRNYWYFLNFLTFAVITCIYLLITSFYKISVTGIDTSKWTLFIGIYSSCCLPYMILLLIFHICLGLTGITTREYFGAERHEGNSQIQDVCLNPFNSKNKGLNIRRQWFRERGNATVAIRARHISNDLRFEKISIGALNV